MNKNWKLGLSFVTALLWTACSDNDISSAEALGENLPPDFVVSEYAQVNPDLANYQLMVAVREHNDSLLSKVREDSISVWKAAIPATEKDSIKQSVLEKSPDLTGAALDSAVDATITKSLDAKAQKIGRSFDDDAEQAVFYDDEAAVKSLFVDYANINAAYWPGMNVLKEGLLAADSSINIDGQRALEYRAALAKFHCLGNTASQDVKFLQAQRTQLDSSEIEQHYWLSGRFEGRPYRYCHAGEAKHQKFLTTVKVDEIPDTTWEYVEKDSVVKDSMAMNPLRYVLVNETLADTIEKSVVGLNLDSLVEAGYVVTDTLKWEYTEKKITIKEDSTAKVSTRMATTIIQKPVSANARAYNGNMDRVWDFSADAYCRNKDDGEVYIIEQ